MLWLAGSLLILILTFAQTNHRAVGQVGRPQAANATAQVQKRSLVPGEATEKEIGGTEVHSYELTLTAGQFLRVVVDQRGANVVVILNGPGGEKLTSVDLLWILGPEPVSYEATKTGNYRLEVRPVSAASLRGPYRITSEIKPTATEADRERRHAEKLLTEANKLGGANAKETSHEAIEKYQESLSLWRKLGDRYWEAYAISALGDSYSVLSDKQKAQEFFERGLDLRRSIRDHKGIASSLYRLGRLFGTQSEKKKALAFFDELLPFLRQTGSIIYQEYMLATIGDACLNDLHEPRKALDYFNQALSLEKSLNDPSGQTYTLQQMARAYDRLGEKKKALDLLFDVLERHKSGYYLDDKAPNLSLIASIYRDLHEPRKAIDYYNQALALHKTQENKAETLQHLAHTYQLIGENEKALERLKLVLELRRALGDRQGQADALTLLGVTYHFLSEFPKAIEADSEALAISRALKDRRREANVLTLLGGTLMQQGELQKGRESLEQSVSLFRALKDRGGEALALRSLAGVFMGRSEFQKSLELLNQALAISKSLDDREAQAIALGALSVIYSYLGDKAKGEESYAQAQALQKDGGHFMINAVAVMFSGVASLSNEDPEKALNSLNQTLQMFRNAKDRNSEATVLNAIGEVYCTLGDYEKALDSFNQSLQLSKALANRVGERSAIASIGWTYIKLKKYTKALEYLTESLTLAKKMSSSQDDAVALDNIGTIYYKLAKYQLALEYFKKALAIFQKNGSRRNEAGTLTAIGSAYTKLRQPQRALDYHTRALAVYREVSSLNGGGKVFSNLMELSAHQNKPGLAILYGKQAVNLFQETRLNLRQLDRGLQASYLKTREETYRQLADLLIAEGRLPEAQQVLGFLKEEEYFEFVRRDPTTDSLLKRSDLTREETKAVKRYDEIAGSITQLAQEFETLRKQGKSDAPRYQELRADLEAANRTFAVFLRQIEDEFGKRGSIRKDLSESEGLRADLEQMPAGTVALQTLVSEKNYRVILTTSNLQVAREANPATSPAKLNKLVLDFRQALQNPAVDPRPLGQKLYHILIAPIANDLKASGAKTLVWSLDGTLRYLPIAALHDGRQYLVEQYQNVIITPASHTRLQAPVGNEMVGLGLGVSKGIVKEWGTFGALPAVPEELLGIIREAKNGPQAKGIVAGRILLDEAFTAKAMGEALAERRYSLVHIASHFSFKPGNETDSFLLLGGGDRLTLDQINVTAGGKFFQKVELLTLSACDTATGGETNGREVEGFAVLAQRQGAQAVLATLWPVRDESTKLFMQQFYQQRVTSRLTKAESLQQAQLFLLQGNSKEPAAGEKKSFATAGRAAPGNPNPPFVTDPETRFSHPYFWAPFILIGNWR